MHSEAPGELGLQMNGTVFDMSNKPTIEGVSDNHCVTSDESVYWRREMDTQRRRSSNRVRGEDGGWELMSDGPHERRWMDIWQTSLPAAQHSQLRHQSAMTRKVGCCGSRDYGFHSQYRIKGCMNGQGHVKAVFDTSRASGAL
jgi:hypothetical protein